MPAAVLIWVWFCAWLNFAGWTLSALHELNARGYAVALAAWLVVFLVWRKKTSAQILPQFHWQKHRRRFRRLFPLAFLILASLAFLGGALYPPTNYDALAYRLPRVLHWLAADQWHWIHTMFPRVNQRACGVEWVSAPFLALLKTDRLLFLINVTSFLLLPGLVFSVFTRLGVRRRVAWHWMWIVPTGYCFLLQAGSVGNDLFGAPFALAAVGFALRAKVSKSPRDVLASILAAALMTGAKTSDLPLLLPWGIAMLPSLTLVLRRPVLTAVVCLFSIFASFLPTAALNTHYCNDWTGWKSEGTPQKDAPLLRMPANAVLITVQNLTPPVFPFANQWNRAIQQLLPQHLSLRLHEAFVEPEAAEFRAGEMQTEEGAGLGFGVTLLFFISVAFAAVKRGKSVLNLQPGSTGAAWQSALRLAPWISLLALLSQSEVYPIDRILAPYYALLLPLFLANPAHEPLVKKTAWRMAALAGFVMAAGLLLVSPARPLFPVQTILKRFPDAPMRVRNVYSVYAGRNDAFAPARDILPPGLRVLGLTTYDDPETSLWRPFGSRRIEHVCPNDTAEQLKARGVEYILVRGEVFGLWFNVSLDDWLKKLNAQVVQPVPLTLRASAGPRDWYLVRLQ